MDTRYIVVTGGVLSGLGKGIALASIGNLLSSKYKVIPIKCDGYLNVDPGTMNPVEHGEVFVLDDGTEVDMDFGHYERFLGISCKKDFSLTMGKVFEEIRKKERMGDYLGKTVQMIPHVSNYIRNYFVQVGEENNADVVLIEIGGTVGDMENELFIDAVRSLSRKVGRDNVLFIHVTYVPIPASLGEPKSKPTQQSVAMLRQRGIEPQIIITRSRKPLTDKVIQKISSMSNLEFEEIISGVDVDNVYKIPLLFEQQGMSQLLSRKLNLQILPDLKKWEELINKRDSAQKEITIAIAGKYTALEDSYASIIEAIHHCEAIYGARINIKWIETSNNNLDLDGVSGVIVPGGFGSRGVEGKIEIVKKCRENKIPFLGICFGLQMAVIEFARNICGLNANSTEIDPTCEHPVIDILEEQKSIESKGGTMRLGSHTAFIKEGSIVHRLYANTKVEERHRHRYEVNPKYHKDLIANGLILSGVSPDGTLVEFIELENHPFFVATQGHPELKSSLLKPAPLFRGLIGAALKFDEEKQHLFK
ncbi:MAG TPA: CTP synthase (glutamine hydrolyzing) [Candidatus Nanoarchaeia archaeon]|nr:CTP synthase (glutamine hydrolyzing) [Candidatus Nanoarchaeia archaeon]